jgi:hypothetical protein
MPQLLTSTRIIAKQSVSGIRRHAALGDHTSSLIKYSSVLSGESLSIKQPPAHDGVADSSCPCRSDRPCERFSSLARSGPCIGSADNGLEGQIVRQFDWNQQWAESLAPQGLFAVLVPARARRHVAGVIVGPSVLRPGPGIWIVRRLRAPLADLESNGRPGKVGIRGIVLVRVAPSRIGLRLVRRLYLLCSRSACPDSRQPDTQPHQRDASLQPHLSPPMYAPMAGAITLAEIAGGSNSKSEHGRDD